MLCSQIAAMIASKDKRQVVLALQLAHTLLAKLPSVFQAYFRREGVAHALRRLAEDDVTKELKQLLLNSSNTESPTVPVKSFFYNFLHTMILFSFKWRVIFCFLFLRCLGLPCNALETPRFVFRCVPPRHPCAHPQDEQHPRAPTCQTNLWTNPDRAEKRSFWCKYLIVAAVSTCALTHTVC